ncbi:MAG: OB-fold nucleic acid binding domain-containing protein, partial [Microvirga sp.]
MTLKVRVTEHRPGPPRRGKAPFRILVEDDTGDILLVFFNAHPERIQALLPVGSVRYVSGKIEIWDGYRQMVHPDRILDERRIGELPAVEAVYGLTEGLSTRLVGKFVGAALGRVPALPEWQDQAFLERSRFPAFGEALHQLHRPAAAADVSPEAAAASPARRRLAYDELLASQLALALVRSRMRRLPG